jgi:hypothetical protein
MAPTTATTARRRPVRVAALLLGVVTLAAACSGGGKSSAGSSASAGAFKPPEQRTPEFEAKGQEAPTVTVLNSFDPTTIIQFPLSASGAVKAKFGAAKGLVTIVHSEGAPSDTLTVDVEGMPPESKFTVFLTELSATPFGHAEYVGDLLTREDGTGESVFHLIAIQAFAADNRNPGHSADQSGDASGVQLEHLGLWFDGIDQAKAVLGDKSIESTPFDGGHPPLHAGPQMLTDGQDLPVL